MKQTKNMAKQENEERLARLKNIVLSMPEKPGSFYVGENLTQEDIKAKYENGILRLSVPKKEAKPVETKKTIAIEG